MNINILHTSVLSFIYTSSRYEQYIICWKESCPHGVCNPAGRQEGAMPQSAVGARGTASLVYCSGSFFDLWCDQLCFCFCLSHFCLGFRCAFSVFEFKDPGLSSFLKIFSPIISSNTASPPFTSFSLSGNKTVLSVSVYCTLGGFFSVLFSIHQPSPWPGLDLPLRF